MQKPGDIYSIEECWRYLANAKETLSKSPIEYGRYTDSKYVQEAAGIAYLSALKAIDVFLLSRGVSKNELPKSIEEYEMMVRTKMPHNGKLMAAINTIYENLHILAYYRGGTDVKMVKLGFENCKRIIEMIFRTLGTKSSPPMVSEPRVTYGSKKKKK
jgi:hypothetical protein